MALAFAQFERLLKDASTLKPVYLLASDEPLLLLELADKLRQKARELGYSERDVLDVESGFDWNNLARAGASMSLFASRRIIDLRLPTGKPGAEGAAAISEYCQNPSADLILIINAMQWNKSHLGKWVQAVEAVGEFVECKLLYRDDLPKWVAERARSRKVPLSNDAVLALTDRIEGNLLAAAQEIDKLALLAPGRNIDTDVLLELVADSARFDVFALVEAALAGDGIRTRRVLAGLKSEGEQVAALCGWLLMSMQLLLKMTDVPKSQVDSALKQERVFGSRFNAYKKALARGDRRFWEERLAEVSLVDRVSKGRADGDAFLVLERLLLRMADKAAAKRLKI